MTSHHGFRRFIRYLSITAGITFIAYLARTCCGMFMARQGVETLAAAQEYVYLGINLLSALIAAALNRRYVFRSTLAWGIAIPVMVLLELLFDTLTGMLWQPVMQEVLRQSTESSAEPLIGNTLANASYAFNLVQFALWTVLGYLFQRFVLYRTSLDASLITNEKENPNE